MIYIWDIGLRVALGILSLAWHHILEIGFIGGYLVSWRMTFKRTIWGILKKYPKVGLDWHDITGAITTASIVSVFFPIVFLYLASQLYAAHHTPMEVAKKLGGRPPKDIEMQLLSQRLAAADRELGFTSTELEVNRPDVIDL